MRRELGSKSGMCHLETSCYRRMIFGGISVIFGFNDSLTSLLLDNTVKRSHRLARLELGKYSASGTREVEITAQRSVFMAAMRYSQEPMVGIAARLAAISVTWEVLGSNARRRPRGGARCDELATEPRAFNLASCCTCAPAMLAKPRF